MAVFPQDTAARLARTSSIMKEIGEALSRLTTALDDVIALVPAIQNAYDTLPVYSSQATPPGSSPAASTTRAGLLTPAEVEARLRNVLETEDLYLVSCGLVPGLYDTQAEANLQILGVRGGSMKKVTPKSAALTKYADLYNRNILVRTT